MAGDTHTEGRWTLKRGNVPRTVVAYYDGRARSVHYDVPWVAYALGKLLARLNAAPAPDDTTGDTP